MAITGITNVVVSGALGSGEAFVSMYNWLTTSGSTSAGIQLIAHNSGSRWDDNGGFNYPQLTNPIGNNAWAVFCWTSASVPFYMLMQVGTGSSGTPFGQAPGNPGSLGTFFARDITFGGVALSFAQRADGLSPWNGTTNLDGHDTKGNPVWTAGTSSLLAYPRANSHSGSNATSTDLCTLVVAHSFVNGTDANGTRLHAAADFDNIAVVWDSFNLVNTYGHLAFGKYDVYHSSSLSSLVLNPTVPYIMFTRRTESALDPVLMLNGINIGSYNCTTAFEGGVANPDPTKGVVGLNLDTLMTAYNNLFHPNRLYAVNTWDEYPLIVFMNEFLPTSASFGMLGQYDFLRAIYNCWVGDTNSGATRVVIGSQDKGALSSKFTMPWNPSDTLMSASTVGKREGSIY